MGPESSPHRFGGKLTIVLCLALIFSAGLLPRLYSAWTLGWNWDGPDSFTLVNFDEGGSCRAALQGFDYSPFIGYQTIAIASVLGYPPPAGITGDMAQVKRYCHSSGHLRVARVYSAVSGALTPILLALISLCLWPSRPRVALTAAALLALSGFHISQSHSGTVDAPSTFFIYLFLTAAIVAASGYFGRWFRYGCWLLLPLLLIFAVWTKYWVFALLAVTALLPLACWQWFARGWLLSKLLLACFVLVLAFTCVTNFDFPATAYLLLVLVWLLVPWRQLDWWARILWLLLPVVLLVLAVQGPVIDYVSGTLEGRFGSGYGAIGWHKWLRNLLNVPLLLMLGLGLPALLMLPLGIRALWRAPPAPRILCCGLPLLAFALFMLFPVAVTYYRHYLPLLPLAALLAAVGYWSLPGRRPWRWWPLFLLWPALLAFDLEMDYHRDPRIELRQWYAQAQPNDVLMTYYVNPPTVPGLRQGLFKASYARNDGRVLRQARYLILSENWYDTAFANELNGPLVGDLNKLIKTRPEDAAFYRAALAGELNYLHSEKVIEVDNFMPELSLHKRLYGTFQLFVGDIHILRIDTDRQGL
ncbi:MAG: hypothetical protein ACK5ME_12980 [Parahaliea sp.]